MIWNFISLYSFCCCISTCGTACYVSVTWNCLDFSLITVSRVVLLIIYISNVMSWLGYVVVYDFVSLLIGYWLFLIIISVSLRLLEGLPYLICWILGSLLIYNLIICFHILVNILPLLLWRICLFSSHSVLPFCW